MAVERFSKKLKEWDEDKKKVVKLIPEHLNEWSDPTTLNLLGTRIINSPSSSSSCGLESIESESIEDDMLVLGQGQCLPSGVDKCSDFKTGPVYYLDSGETGLSSVTLPGKEISGFDSTEEEDKGLELQLDLSNSNALKYSRKNSTNYIDDCTDDNSASEIQSAMRLVGCLACLTYYMVCRKEASCPRCKGSFLLDFPDGDLSSP
ncbi:hypothetical protein SUGI_0731350 [Cryptomeria japonica]|uniref:protein CURLY FLAG LEAF 2 n=1 Tax=Cryptomeria japonica TaxID=3369 RepID=UPI00241489CB|nr:protein CURLY FLAG LEAF 2 [Cryptomeria japonica]GLJ36424.1 hypothetical protein SUGI_0731350 [Cryptomeria japonica]